MAASDYKPEGWVAKTLPEIIEGLETGSVSAVELVDLYLDRIERMNTCSPDLRAVLALNPEIRKEARFSDEARKQGQSLGALHGAPILIKDNIEVAGPMATTAGSLALKDNVTGRDAPIVRNLREAGALILGKANLSEWANFRSNTSISGWSALGGQTKNPHLLSHQPCGSSSGSGAGVAASLCAAAIGTETSGSIICPAALNGIVGFKPTVGLLPTKHIIPISKTTDTAGPMTKTVKGAAILMDAMSGSGADFRAQITSAKLNGARIGVLGFGIGNDKRVRAAFEGAVQDLEEAGAECVQILTLPKPAHIKGEDLGTFLKFEFKATLNDYLATTPQAVAARSLSDLIAFNTEHAKEELGLFDQSLFEESEKMASLDDPDYLDLRDRLLMATRQNGIDALLSENDVDVLIAPSECPAGPIDPKAERVSSWAGVGWMPAIAGYPHLTVPMGTIGGLPVGLSFIASAGQDAKVLQMGYAYEQATKRRVEPEYKSELA